MNDPKAEMKPCPFCGGEAEISETHLPPTMSGPGALITVTVRHWCGPAAAGIVASHVEFRGRDHASAIAAWNTRTPTTGFNAGLEAAVKSVAVLLAEYKDDPNDYSPKTVLHLAMSAIRALKTAPGADGWLRIEDMPEEWKDGREVAIGWERTGDWVKAKYDSLRDGTWFCPMTGESCLRPTHVMAIPPLPTPSPEDNGNVGPGGLCEVSND